MMKHTINIKRQLFSVLRIFDSVRVVFNEQDSTEQSMKYNGKELMREWGIEALGYDY